MKVSIIGNGSVGQALGMRIKKTGHDVNFAVRDMQKESTVAIAEKTGVLLTNLKDAALADMVIIAAPAAAVESIIETLGPMAGKIVIDASNTIRPLEGRFATAFHLMTDKLEAAVVKCFNTTGFENMSEPDYGKKGLAVDMFMAGDDDSAKATVRQLCLDMGFAECYDLGSAEKALLLEGLAKLWINLSFSQPFGRNFMFKLITRE